MHADLVVNQVHELTQPQAHALRDAIKLRRRLLNDATNALYAALVTVGAQVTTRDIINPARYRGLSGTVQAKNGKYATVLLDEASTAKLASQTGRNRVWMPEGTTRHSLDGIPVETLEVRDAPDGFGELAKFLINEAAPELLTSVDAARKQRLRALAADIGEGDPVMVTDVTPKFLAGLTGAVKSVDYAGGTCVVYLDENSTKQLRLEDSPRYPVEASATTFPLRLGFEQILLTGGL
ncbi:hypothetical protein [Amycolatopsis sp. cmx-4-54]|uniref:hypothetical protein n=1 Tax=Amycolatopsis sp. cmx-4-54 TaxID=2790936 RepID=UPI00397E421F